MLKKILSNLLALTVFLTACAPQGTPTMAPANAQNTAVSAVWTMAAATQLANPTATSLPPTEMPSPTVTPAPVIATLEQLTPPTSTAVSSDPNNCNKTLNVGEAGPTKNVRIENETKGQVNLSLNLYKPNEFGQCGSLSYVIKSGEKRKVVIPSGSWSAFAWILNPASQVGPRDFYIGPSSSQDLLRLVIKKDVIAWVGP
jgi:hypothetical protein